MRACSDELRHESLDDLLADPVAVLMMASDGVDPAEVRALIAARVPAPQSRTWTIRASHIRRECLPGRGRRHT